MRLEEKLKIRKKKDSQSVPIYELDSLLIKELGTNYDGIINFICPRYRILVPLAMGKTFDEIRNNIIEIAEETFSHEETKRKFLKQIDVVNWIEENLNLEIIGEIDEEVD